MIWAALGGFLAGCLVVAFCAWFFVFRPFSKSVERAVRQMWGGR